MMKMTGRYAASFILSATILLLASCTNLFDNERTVPNNATEYGSLTVGAQENGRYISPATITSATVTVHGAGITSGSEPSAANVSLTSGGGSCTINTIPVGKNKIIRVQAEKDGDSHTKMDGVVLYAVTDISAGSNSASVNWSTTAFGSVFYKLNELGADVSAISDADKSSIAAVLPTYVATNKATHPLLINTTQVAADYITKGASGLKSASSYTLAGATVTFTITGIYNGYTAYVCDPVSDTLTALVIGTNTISSIAPGTWVFKIADSGGTVQYNTEITVAAGETKDLGTLSLGTVTYLLGEKHPSTGSYSPVDVNGDTSGTGWSSASWSLGATVTGSNTTFAVYSSTATKVLLEIYSAAYGVDASYDYWMEKGSNSVWRAEVTGVGAGTIYGFRCWGPNWTYNASWARGDSSAGFVSDCDASGNRFNPNKVLFDPYGKEMTHDQSNATALGTKTTAYLTSGATYRNYDTGKYAPKCYVVSDSTSFGTKPAIVAKDAIIYEAHVRGLTNSTSTASLTTILSGYSAFSSVVNVPAEYRGTYKGAAYMAPYLKALGINTIELLPVQETDNDANPSDGPGGNFWGYMTFDYFAPDRRYSYDKTAGGPTKEFKEMVKAFHDAGMEVYMDVVYNHTGEGGPWQGSTDSYQQATVVSMRGFDNSTYYCLVSGTPASYWETTGCGNNMQCDNATVRNLITDSLSYWISTMGVDGFRFDLATVLGRVKNGTSWDYSSSATTLTTIASLGTSTSTEMIAESWDCGSNSYQVGNFPSGWAGWNGRYRDTMRNFIDNGTCNSGISYATGIYGDTESGFSTSCPSINFIVAHDGFTLADLCSYSGTGNYYNSKLTWPFGPSDGGNSDTNNLTSISGTDTADRRQRIRNFFTIQMFSAGIPMIVYGDEFGRTQNGNNNPYNIDSVATWNNYAMINSAAPQSVATGGSGAYSNMLGTFGNTDGKNGNFDFARYVMNLRAGDDTLRQITGAASHITYYKNTYTESGYSSDSDRCAGVLISGTNKYYLMINMYTSQVSFTFPAPDSGKKWTRIIDTANWAETNCNYWLSTDTTCTYTASGSYGVNPWSIVVLEQVAQ